MFVESHCFKNESIPNQGAYAPRSWKYKQQKEKDMMKLFYSLLLPFVFACLFACTGCKPRGLDVHAVEGIVTLDGKPFSGVTITLDPVEEGNMGFANTDSQGYYKISTLGGTSQKGTTLGTYKIGFNKIVATGGGESGATVDLAPKKYRDPNTSGFEITVKKGANIHNFELKSK